MTDTAENTIFNRLTLLVGEQAMAAIASQRVIVFGVGGVGSWCAESLVRNGIRHLTLVDSDRVCVTNVNRQLQATTKTVGQVKVEVLKERLLDINPQADIQALQEIYTAENADRFHLEEYDYIIDAIDSLQHKAQLILHATGCPGTFFSSMGAALKIDPTRVSVAEFWKVFGCPLARALRKRFKRLGKLPRKKFRCVYSPELLPNKGEAALETGDSGSASEEWSATKAQINGTTSHVTAIFGFTLAGLVIQDICASK
jgi:tRNA A37 threonylcarbamoyladenosine dehydratase